MTKTCRFAVAALVCALTVAPLSESVFAASGEVAAARATTHLLLNGQPLVGIDTFSVQPGLPPIAAETMDANAVMLQPNYMRPRHRNQGAAAAIFLGAAGTIVGSAALVYANRPECGVSQNASGCGYGTKVAGGAVLAAGVVGLILGAALWR